MTTLLKVERVLTFRRRHLVVLAAVVAASACGPSGAASPTAPSVTSTPTEPNAATLTGQVTDSATSGPIAGATVTIGLRATTTDGSGNYRISGFGDSYTWVSADGYESDYRFIRTSVQNVHLHRIEQITAGESKFVTIAPDDTLCVNNVQDTPGLGPDYVCRIVRVVAPTDGVMRLEARTLQGLLSVLEVETRNVTPCCSERLENPTSIQVKAGTEVAASVEMPLTTGISQSFILTTSMAPQ